MKFNSLSNYVNLGKISMKVPFKKSHNSQHFSKFQLKFVFFFFLEINGLIFPNLKCNPTFSCKSETNFDETMPENETIV